MRGDRDELLRVAENLIENAIKYSAPETGEPERTVWIEVGSRDGFGVCFRCATRGRASRRKTFRA